MTHHDRPWGSTHGFGRLTQLAVAAALALAAIAALARPVAGQTPTPAGTVISAHAEASYDAPNGARYTVQSNRLAMVVAQVAGVDLTPARSTIANPGARVVFAHTLTNLGNGTDSMAVTGQSAAGWPVRVYLDADGDGQLGAGDPELIRPVTLAMGASAAILLAVDVPGTAGVRGTRDVVTVVATCQFDGSTSDALVNTLDIQDVGVLVTLTKSVDRPQAAAGDVLTYTITYTVTGTNPATSVVIADPIPFGTAYLPGSMRWNGASLTDDPGDAGRFDVAGNRVLFLLGDVAPGQSGTVSFQVRVGG